MKETHLCADPFRLLGDPVRFRILRLLFQEQLNVGELTRILGIAQSGVSRHVRLLKDGGFVDDVREGGWTWLALTPTTPDGLGAAWAAIRSGLAAVPDGDGDDARLAVIRQERHERRVGWGGEGAAAEPGRSWSAWARALGHVLEPLVVADLGCGTGALTLEVASWAARVDAVDRDAGLLEQARENAERTGTDNVRWRVASLSALPLDDATYDLALLSQVLHTVADPVAVVGEAVRIVRPGGRVLVLDLLPHEETWVKEKLGHVRLGFHRDEVAGLLEDAGLEGVRAEEAARRRGNPFTVLVASGLRPCERGSS